VKGVKKIGVRLGSWLTAEQSQRLWQAPNGERMKEKRDRALLAILLACGVRRHEAVNLNFGHIQQREEHWAIVDLKGKAGHVRTIPMPAWVKNLLDNGSRPRTLRRANCSVAYTRSEDLGERGLQKKLSGTWFGSTPRKPESTS
jgi:site-specific recombinase XerD